MPDFFDTVKNFQDVPTDPGISTPEYLEACRGTVKVFDMLGSTAFAAVISDMNGNIKKIQERYDAEPEKSKTLQELVENETAEKKKTASEGLLWLNRGLEFTCLALEDNAADGSKELDKSFGHSYENTLKKHHNFVVKGIFSVALKATPYRKEFYKKFGDDEPKVNAQMNSWLKGLRVIVNTTNQMDLEEKIKGCK